MVGATGLEPNQIAEIAFINPLYPPVLGDFIITGGHPQTLGRMNPAPLFHSVEQWLDSCDRQLSGL